MLLNLSDVLTTEGKVQTEEIPLEAETFASAGGDFRITEKSPVAFTFTNIGAGKARVEGSCSLKFKTACDRCLKEVPLSMDLSFDTTVISPEVESEDEEAEDNRKFMEGYHLDTEAFVYDEISVNWPMKILCREDCKGVCPVCGQDLNERECGCDTFVPDPRMAAIKDIFDAGKEV